MIRRWLERNIPDPVRREQVWELAMILPNLARLLGRLAVDPRVPRRAKAVAAVAAAYALSPIDLVPDFVPLLGKTDDLLIVAFAVRHLVEEAGLAVVREHWDGPDRTITLIIDLVTTISDLIPRPVRIAVNRLLRSD